jgi:two-component system, OmpR family, alkaline phosphatase synthesis response regulator PhoP
MHIAIVEDDPNLGELLNLLITKEIGKTQLFVNGWQALDEIRSGNFDLVVLDIMLPGVNGLEICRQLRQSGKNMPILMLTSKSDEDDKVTGLEMGADDYLTKPFSNKELIARIKSLSRRAGISTNTDLKTSSSISIGELVLNPSEHTLTKNGQIIDLSPKEFELLYLFMDQAGRNFSRIDLLERIWGDHFEGLEHTINSNINRLRSKIEDNPGSPKYLVTVWGVGYRFNKAIS